MHEVEFWTSESSTMLRCYRQRTGLGRLFRMSLNAQLLIVRSFQIQSSEFIFVARKQFAIISLHNPSQRPIPSTPPTWCIWK